MTDERTTDEIAALKAHIASLEELFEVHEQTALSQARKLEHTLADLEQRTRDLESAQESLRSARDAADASNQAKSEFLANMSHELRTPLNAILGFTQLMLRDQGLAAEHQENLEVITQSGEHLLDLINDVLEMSKIEAGRQTLYEDNFDLHDLLHGLEQMFRSRASGKGLQLMFERTPDVPQYVRTDASKLRQVLMNLLSNAVKFTQEGGVTLRCDCDMQPMSGGDSESGERVHLLFQVEDTGPGIAQEELEHLFEAFGQTATGRQAQEGTGLGLAISRMFINLMGGDLSVDSEVGRGSVFTFDLLISVTEAAEVQTRPSRRRGVGVEPGHPVYRLLVVEDRLENRRLLVKLLEPWGFEVREASNGQEGIEVWEQWDPHLIWMDMRMPVMDGYEATKRIKTTTKGQATVVVALTASVFEEQRTVVLSTGCDDFMRKPFREQGIVDVLSRHLGVRFLYDDQLRATSTQAEDRAQDDLTPEALAALPAQWLEDVHQAAQRGDMDTMLGLLAHIEADHAPLAKALKALIQDFRFGDIIALTQPGEDV